MSAPVEDGALAAFQDALVELMVQELPAPELARRLRADARAAPFADYVAALDTRCVELVSLLQRRWADRAP
ncbi:MAG: hypothetical protein ACXVDD_00335 [Polyangia bacterium]